MSGSRVLKYNCDKLECTGTSCATLHFTPLLTWVAGVPCNGLWPVLDVPPQQSGLRHRQLQLDLTHLLLPLLLLRLLTPSGSIN